MTYDRAESRAKCRATVAKRIRELRLSLGYKTAASFARAIGYPPAKICRYEREGFTQGGTLMEFVWAVDKLGLGKISIDWLFDTRMCQTKWLWLPAKWAVRTEGNVLHGNFAR